MAPRALRHLADLEDAQALRDPADDLDRLALEAAAMVRAVEEEIADGGGPLAELASRVAPLSALAAPDDAQARGRLARRRRWQRRVRETDAFREQPPN